MFYRRSSEVPSVEDQRQINWEVSGSGAGRSAVLQPDVPGRRLDPVCQLWKNKAALGGELLIQHHVSESAASNLKNLQKTKQNKKPSGSDK